MDLVWISKNPRYLDAFTDNSANGGVFAGLNRNNVTQEKAAEVNSFLKQLNKEFVPFKKSPQLDYNLGVEYGDFHELTISHWHNVQRGLCPQNQGNTTKVLSGSTLGSGEINQISGIVTNLRLGLNLQKSDRLPKSSLYPTENELGLILLYSHTGEKKHPMVKCWRRV